jgi:nucleotide-binding universal stress UspA family protein
MKASSKILVPVDFTSRSAAAVRRAVELARPTGAEIILLQFHDAVEYPLPFDSIVSTRAHLQQLSEPLLERLEAARSAVERLGVHRVTSRYEYGDPAAGIIRIAAEEGCALIVMGTHGSTGLSRWLTGSVTEKVMRGAPCPVLTAKVPRNPRAAASAQRGRFAEQAVRFAGAIRGAVG